jgi:hypothetical protein
MPGTVNIDYSPYKAGKARDESSDEDGVELNDIDL